ncbi:MAG: integration host factor subunit beta [Gammaproteobacteria bacterium]|nr:integration host factor subunit beta [Gammaproteobacteria bacterium]NIR82471.1 integration host factor subunit beta [Gammaproteobacteria bacterium]NIR88467.1 integration host factor subunit beta [Gammaproteobacteria bacterium]NIU03607.1 integration host factor subunit beta [Gammaproteobacteria bacterium]NIV50959.1 integration host factor subunit beta [Gammaproteobacteria bacterium]
MTKSELIERIAAKQPQLAYRDVELAVKTILEHMAQQLASGERIEIRGFGSFSLHYRPGRVGRNPKTGAPVSLPPKHVPHFKPGKELRERVDNHANKGSERDVHDDVESEFGSSAAIGEPRAKNLVR